MAKEKMKSVNITFRRALLKKLTWDEAKYVGNTLIYMDQQLQFAIGDFLGACVGLFGDDAYQLPVFNYSISISIRNSFN